MGVLKEENVLHVVLPNRATVTSLQTAFSSLVSRLSSSPFSNVQKVELDDLKTLKVRLDHSSTSTKNVPCVEDVGKNEIHCLMQSMSVTAFIEQMNQFTKIMSSKYPHSTLAKPLSYKLTRGVFIVNGDTTTPSQIEPEVPKQSIISSASSTTKKDGKTLLIIDGQNLLSRAYYATASGSYSKKTEKTPYIMRRSDGTPTNAIHTFIEMLFNMLRNINPSALLIAWDAVRSTTFRRGIYPGYKASRDKLEKPAELKEQEPLMWELLNDMGIPQLCARGYEADDIIGTFARRWVTETEGEVYISSNDRDLFQLLHERVHILRKDKGQDVKYTIESLKEQYGLKPHQIVDLKALVGDTSDDIPGVRGVGETKAPQMIAMYKSIEDLYEQLSSIKNSEFKRYYKSLEAGYDSAMLSKKLATIVDIPEYKDIPLEDLALQLNKQGMIAGFRRMEFHSFLERMGITD
ncbi:5'-3' exonuclease H3TH domain-containing protein [Aneurinibacillus migulanus]|uniref:5'-3' exonuclease n=1 Tax=Aneurinibacillus migulanus TaxID=47500 RepID=UPI002E1A4F22|nr:5'-3' exonuclease H3TH domain-containing protein [Aneurinibacillus migulanus]MED4728661.1 5'-3' exonuclease H3TH domain-containing protein [Aneurinibacillus migulanus]